MSAGTKISLAVIALLIVVLVVYYGSLSGDVELTLAKDEPAAAAADRNLVAETPALPQPEQTRPRQRESTSRETLTEPAFPRLFTGPSRVLGDSVGSALEPDRTAVQPRVGDTGESPRHSSLRDRSPVVVGEPRESDGGKDAPPPPPAPRDEADADADAEDTTPDEPQGAPEPQPREQPRPRIAPQPEYSQYTVKQGDTMSSIARDWFGDESKWDLIARANPLVDPNRLRIGQTLRLPPKDSPRQQSGERAGATQTTYVVRSGDSLSRIAQQYYGDSSKWRIIFEANRRTIGASPDNLQVGMRLTIPPAPKPAE